MSAHWLENSSATLMNSSRNSEKITRFWPLSERFLMPSPSVVNEAKGVEELVGLRDVANGVVLLPLVTRIEDRARMGDPRLRGAEAEEYDLVDLASVHAEVSGPGGTRACGTAWPVRCHR